MKNHIAKCYTNLCLCGQIHTTDVFWIEALQLGRAHSYFKRDQGCKTCIKVYNANFAFNKKAKLKV